MPKVIRFKLKGRKAILEDVYFQNELRDLLSFYPPGFRFSPAYKYYLRKKAEGEEGGWNGKISMLKQNVLPVGVLIGAQKEIRDAGFKIKLLGWQHRPHIQAKKGFKETDPKYDFQNTCVQQMLACLSKGGGTVLSATGSGKTKTTAQFFSWIGAECVFVVDQVNLLYQAQKELSLWLKESVGIVGHGKFTPKRITVATIQTLWAHRKKLEFKKWIQKIRVLVIDELHKQMSRRNFRIVDIIRPQAVIGLTATLQMKRKEIRWKVYSVAGPVIYEFPVAKGIESGVLAKGSVVQITVPDSGLLPTHIIEEITDPKQREYLAQVVYHPVISRKVYKLTHAAIAQKQAVVILCERIAHLKLIQNKLAEFKLEAVHGSVPEHDRRRTIMRFENGKTDIIVASSVFTKGVNIKRISLIIDLAQRKNPNDALQKLGRGLRQHEDKDFLRYIDFCTLPSMKAHGSRRRNAFKKAGIPVQVVPYETSAKDILDICEKQLSKNSKKKAS